MKPKILVKHTRIEISNYEMGDCSSLEYMFSVWDPVYHCSLFKGLDYNEETKTLYLPRGMDIQYLEDIFCTNAVVDKNNDEYENIDPIPIKYLTRDDMQKQAIKFTLGVDEYKYTKSKSQLSVNLGTGKGKTFVAVATICFSGSRTIIITNSIDWLKQWKEKILEYTPLDEKEIYMITGSNTIDKLLCRDPLKYKIFLASHATIKSYGDTNGWDAIDNLFKYIKVGLKIYDEAHLYFDNLCKIDYHSNTKRTLYLTATPARSNRDENVIYQIYFKNIPSIELFNKQQDAHTNYWAIFYNTHPQPIDIQNCRGAYGFAPNQYPKYVVNRPNFLYLLFILIDMTLNIPGKVLIYIGTNAAIKEVYEYLITQFPFLKNCIGIYTSLIKENKSEQLKNKFILSTTKSAGTASDIPDLSVVINIAEPFASKVLAQQTFGRLRGYDTLYIDIIDTGFYATKNYYKSKKSVYQKYALRFKESVMRDDELHNRGESIINKYEKKKLMFTPIFKN